MFSTLISLWAYDLSRAELDRAREVSTTLRDAHSVAGVDHFRPQNLAGFGMLDWFARQLRERRRHARDGHRGPGRGGRRGRRSPPPGSCPMTRPWRCTCTSPWRSSWQPTWQAADGSLARARAVAAESIEFPQGPWSAAYASWLGSWMWIEAGRFDLAEEALADLQLVERATRVRQLGGDRGDADRGARGASARWGPGRRRDRAVARTRRTSARYIEVWQTLRAASVPPLLPDDDRCAAGRRGRR